MHYGVQVMFTIFGKHQGRLCDGISRRDFIQVGALGMGGLTLPRLLQAETRSNVGRSHKAIIMIYMAGAPPHQELLDPKPGAPLEYRGDLGAIPTNVPGIHIGEMLPRMAGIMDKWTAIRSVVGAPGGSHDSFMCFTGREGSTLNSTGQPPGGWPSIGAALSRLQGPVLPDVPAFVGLAPKAGHPPYGSSGKPGYLGPGHGPFKPSGPGMEDMELKGLSPGRLSDRKALLGEFDRWRRQVDQQAGAANLDTFTEQAFGVLTSSRLVDALNLDKEDPGVRARYGKGDARSVGDGAPMNNEHFLLARRLVEAGARCVTLNFGRWDFHSGNTRGMKQHAPIFDQGLSALIEDLHQRGLAEDVSVVAWGEFGRTPKLNKDAGRDHWPQVGCAFVAGGGMRTGQVIGATDKHAAEAVDRPVHFGEVHATLYKNMGIDASATMLTDLGGRPHFLMDPWEPIPELA